MLLRDEDDDSVSKRACGYFVEARMVIPHYRHLTLPPAYCRKDLKLRININFSTSQECFSEATDCPLTRKHSVW